MNHFISKTNNNNSGASLYQIGTTPSRLDSHTVTFRDSTEQWDASMRTTDDATRHVTVHDDVSLDSFFARPIPIYSTTLTPGTSLTSASFNPWALFLNNIRVANRISNYKLFSGKLCVKVLVNGNGFYYGRYMMSYAPYWSYDTAYNAVAANTMPSIMLNSQRLKLFIDPTESQGGQMCLPFLWHADMIDLTTSDYTLLGALTIEELAVLKHANGAVSPITLSVFAWMEDVKLSAPTVQDFNGIVAQAGDEYGATSVSGISSALAHSTGKLTGVPYIGSYMRATSMAASAVSSVASMFGFSRPVNLSISTPMKVRPIGELAATDTADGSVKLTVDSKQELSIDPAIVGLSGIDEMALKTIASKETIVNSFPWTTAATSDTVLFNARVTPSFRKFATGTLGTISVIPACTYASAPFKYWRGTMRYRFMIIASAFHKGRLKFTWDPLFMNPNTETNVQYTKIIDIATERDFVIDVAWGAARSWLQCTNPSAIGSGTFQTQGRYTTNSSCNGVLGVTVLNELTTPNSAVNNDVTIYVSMCMCDDAEFAAPTNIMESWVPVDGSVQAQSGVESEQDAGTNRPEIDDNTEEFVACNPVSDNTLMVYMGESVNSLRQLIKRYAVDYHYSTLTAGVYTLVTSDFPMKFGYTPNGLRGTAPNKFDVCANTMMRYCAMGYMFYRGGVRRKYVMGSNTTAPQFGTMSVSRNSALAGVPTNTTTTLTTTTALTLSDSYRTATPSGIEGVAVTTTRQNPVIEVELPYYRDVRFSLCRRPNSYALASVGSIPFVEDMAHTLSANVWTPATATIFSSYVAGAEDSTFICFQGCTPFYINPTLV